VTQNVDINMIWKYFAIHLLQEIFILATVMIQLWGPLPRGTGGAVWNWPLTSI